MVLATKYFMTIWMKYVFSLYIVLQLVHVRSRISYHHLCVRDNVDEEFLFSSKKYHSIQIIIKNVPFWVLKIILFFLNQWGSFQELILWISLYPFWDMGRNFILIVIIKFPLLFSWLDSFWFWRGLTIFRSNNAFIKIFATKTLTIVSKIQNCSFRLFFFLVLLLYI